MAMLTSGEYNLKKENVVHEKKSMFFVKLTDSAQRALNNYFRAMDKCEAPVIEFNKNEGRILIPTNPKGNKDSEILMAQYKFDVKSNVAMQGRQGRFECVQHIRGSKQLIKYGQLTQRLTIQATEDVYENTKNRMAAIGIEQRKNCTIQLDYSPTNISRKVKIEKNNAPKSLPPVTKTEEPRPVPAPAAAAASNMIRSKSRPIHNPPPQKINPAACIIRKPLKERLIHLLALRPYKKLELYAALNKDGLRECDKPHLSETLSSVSNLRENVYHLSKHAWNEVQEDWLFYTEQEKQQIKNNKLRNLTSPSSSDSGVSVSSNQSPNNNAPSADKYKRPGYSVGRDGFQTKRRRISHFVKQEPGKPNINESNAQSTPNRLEECQRISPFVKQESTTHFVKQESSSYGRFDEISRSSPPTEKSSQKSITCKVTEMKPNSHAEHNHSSRKDVPGLIVSSPEVTSTCNDQDDDVLSFPFTRTKYFRPEGEYTSPVSHNRNEGSAYTPPVSDHQSESTAYTSSASQYQSDAAAYTPSVSKFQAEGSSYAAPVSQLDLSRTHQQAETLQSPQCCQLFSRPDTNTSAWLEKKTPTVKPKYLKEYVTISNMEQRRRYKADFSEVFKEYQRVHEDVDSISNTFAQLGESLKQHKKDSPIYKNIEKEILTRYYGLKQNQKYQAAKRRFDYLHEKLSHIKNLVHEYDQKMLK